MGTTQPIRSQEELSQFMNYYSNVKPNKRNYTLIVVGLHTALRISDVLHLKWNEVYNFALEKCKDHLNVLEHKTGKYNDIALCTCVKDALLDYFEEREPKPDEYIFTRETSRYTPLCRSQAYRIVRAAATETIQSDNISCHSLRKTFGYQAWKQGVQPVMLMEIFNHSSYENTKRYLGITQDEKDKIYLDIQL